MQYIYIYIKKYKLCPCLNIYFSYLNLNCFYIFYRWIQSLGLAATPTWINYYIVAMAWRSGDSQRGLNSLYLAHTNSKCVWTLPWCDRVPVRSNRRNSNPCKWRRHSSRIGWRSETRLWVSQSRSARQKRDVCEWRTREMKLWLALCTCVCTSHTYVVLLEKREVADDSDPHQQSGRSQQDSTNVIWWQCLSTRDNRGEIY